MNRTTIKATVGLFLLAAIILWCYYSSRPRPPKVTEVDLRIAEETAEFLKESLAALPDTHDLIQRYGRFVSLDASPVQRNSAYKVPFGEGGYPACLRMNCRCVFEKYPCELSVIILAGSGEPAPRFYYTEAEYVYDMAPKAETVTTGVLSDCKPQLIDQELWYVREEPDQMAVRCTVQCWIIHRDFVP